MAIPDDIYIEPGNYLTAELAAKTFATVGLSNCFSKFKICKEGHLWRVGRDDPSRINTEIAAVRVPFHGDLALTSIGAIYVARFNSGCIEWIRPIDELSADSRSLLNGPLEEA
ncbi:MAG: hypothetical protein AAGG48_18215 [Planctomycetota bacterium]